VEDGRFLGLVIDEINQPELTAERIAAWVAELVTAFSTPSPSGPVGDVN
jgi:flavodoxin I